MDLLTKKQIGQRLTARVSTGISFLESNYLNNHSTPDPAWIRNIYILLSFYTELQLKAILIVEDDFSDVEEVDRIFRKLGHNLYEIGQRLGPAKLSKYNIEEIKLIDHEYSIETCDGVFNVMDFVDIRYDFLDDKVRTIRGDEHQMFQRQIIIMYKINDQLKPLVW